MHPVVAEAMAAREAGQCDQAETLLRGHLEQLPADADAWHELAAVHCRRGDLPSALPSLERCLALDATHREALTRLGAVLQNLARLEEAQAALERAVAAHPDHGQAWCNLGIVRLGLQADGAVQAAQEALQQALRLDPDHPQALQALVIALRRQSLHRELLPVLIRLVQQRPAQWQELVTLGHALEQQNLLEEAETAYRQALAVSALHPDAAAAPEAMEPSPQAIAQAKLGSLLINLKRYPEACDWLQRAVDLAPAFPEAHGNLAQGLRHQNRLGPSLVASERALALDPQRASFHGLRGMLLRELGRYQDGKKALERAIALDPEEPDYAANLALCQLDLGLTDAAMEGFDRSLALQPDNDLVLTNRGMCRLLISDQQDGWQDYEARLRRPNASTLLKPPTPRWQGEDLAGSPLLLVGEQGFGDMLQTMRYAPLLRQRLGAVALCLPTNLIPLAEASELADVIWTQDQAGAHQGAWLPLFSLFDALNLTPQDLQAPAPYLRVPDDRIAHWRQRIGTGPEPLVGIHWQGNPETETGGMVGRSLPLEQLAPLVDGANLRLVSLQKGIGAEQRLQCSFRSSFIEQQDLIDTAWDYLDTAAILSCCDLLITSDSALAHLAGGLGLPVWLLLKRIPDWRWGLEGEITHWYPSMRLFRQRSDGDWAEVMERVCQQLPSQLARA